MDRFPDDFKVHLVIPVRDAISHRVHDQLGNVIVLGSELRGHALDVA
jgi:hypothetical protein